VSSRPLSWVAEQSYFHQKDAFQNPAGILPCGHLQRVPPECKLILQPGASDWLRHLKVGDWVRCRFASEHAQYFKGRLYNACIRRLPSRDQKTFDMIWCGNFEEKNVQMNRLQPFQAWTAGETADIWVGGQWWQGQIAFVKQHDTVAKTRFEATIGDRRVCVGMESLRQCYTVKVQAADDGNAESADADDVPHKEELRIGQEVKFWKGCWNRGHYKGSRDGKALLEYYDRKTFSKVTTPIDFKSIAFDRQPQRLKRYAAKGPEPRDPLSTRGPKALVARPPQARAASSRDVLEVEDSD